MPLLPLVDVHGFSSMGSGYAHMREQHRILCACEAGRGTYVYTLSKYVHSIKVRNCMRYLGRVRVYVS